MLIGVAGKRLLSRLRRTTALYWLAGPLIPVLLPAAARAQDRPVAVPETVVEGLDPTGFRLGSFVALPRVNFDVRYDDNIYNRADKIEDGVAVVRPSLRVQSDFSRHQIRLDAAAEGRRYFDMTAEDSNQWALDAAGRLDFANRFVLAINTGVARRIERRGTFGDQFFTDRPVVYMDTGVGATLSRMGGIVEWQASVSTRNLEYKDASLGGVEIDQSYRDVRRDALAFRIDYRRSVKLGVFMRLTGTHLAYDLGSSRDSKGFSVVGGLSYRITDLLTVEGALGYVTQKMDDPRRSDIGALDYHLSVSWTPTPRTRFELKGERNVERSPLAIDAAVLQSTIIGTATIAVGSRTFVGLEVGFLRNDYDGFDRRESRIHGEATINRTVTKNIAAFVGFSGRHQRGSGINPREYDGLAARIGARMAI